MKTYVISIFLSVLIGIVGVYAFLKWKEERFKAPSLNRIKTLEKWENEGIPIGVFQWEGAEKSIQDYAGQILILHFWASWCGPCVEELPSLQEFAKKMDNKVFILAFNLDTQIESMESFLKEHKVETLSNLKFIFDKNKTLSQVYQVDRLPESLIISPELKLIKRISGTIDWTTTESYSFFEALHKVESSKQEPIE